MKKVKKMSLLQKNIKIHANLWKVYYSALFVAVSFVMIKELFNA
ncbi:MULTISPECIES: hypothetical protein [unclassified Arcobacter]